MNDGSMAGMTVPLPTDLRDWFAGLAMQGFLTNREFSAFIHDGAEISPLVASNAYEVADLMLKAREARS